MLWIINAYLNATMIIFIMNSNKPHIMIKIIVFINVLIIAKIIMKMVKKYIYMRQKNAFLIVVNYIYTILFVIKIV